jgi:site-specific DNA-methyltransferase (adenine-specific)
LTTGEGVGDSLWYSACIASPSSVTALNDIRLINGDCLEVLESFDSDLIDTCITDPPYGLGFMGKTWDGSGIAFDPETWRRVRRVLKPGAFLLCFGGTRTFHRVTSAIDDAGFEIRDCIVWLYSQGLPKSRNVSAGGFSGWGTGLKPAWEPIIVAVKPLDGTFAQNARRWGVAGFHVDGCRIPAPNSTRGRFPANVLLDAEAARLLDKQSGILKSGRPCGVRRAGRNVFGTYKTGTAVTGFGDCGGASRFFYCAKASRAERGSENDHPTVKPLRLLEYLCRLTKSPRGGIVLDPFLGSGTTAVACLKTGRPCVGIEKDPHYFRIAKRRIAAAMASAK